MTSQPSRRVGLAYAAFALGAVAVHIASAGSRFEDSTYLGIGAVTAAIAWRGAHRQRWKRVSFLIASGVTLSVGGDLTYRVVGWLDGRPPELSVAELGWLGSYVAIATALLTVLRQHRAERADVDGRVDVGVVFVAAMLLQWQFGLQDLLADSRFSPIARIVWALYPALDAVLLALVARALIGRHLRGPSAALLGAGALCWLLSDTALTTLEPSGTAGTWLNAGWLLGGFALAGATWVPSSVTARPSAQPDADQGRLWLGIALLPLLLPGVMEVLGSLHGDDPNPLVTFTATVLLTGLTFARALRLQQVGQEARAALLSREHYAVAVAANSSDALAVVDRDGVILNDARPLAGLVGLRDERLEGRLALDLVAPEDAAAVEATFDRALRSPGQTFDVELRAAGHRDRPLHLAARIVSLLDDPDVGGIVVNLHDITDRKLAEQDLAHQAFHDGLTGLANRALFGDRLAQALRRAERTQQRVAVLFLDLDGFKTVNDGLGHGTGDALLCEVGHRLERAVRPTETVARLGGDEFAVLVEHSDRALDDSEAIAERFLHSLSMPIRLDGQDITVAASIGIAVAGPGATADSMLRDADVAMYRAKANGKGRAVVFDASMRSAVLERLHLEREMAGAILTDQFRLVYQPVVELESERVVGFEALLRWEHPTLGTVPPDRFIPLAEENGLIVPIGAWVLHEACTTAARWHADHPDHRDVTVAVNLSGRQIACDDLADHVATALEDSGLDPSTLVLEMTETVLVQDPEAAAARLHELRALGIRLAIDDFGTGYSSLSYLRQFPVDILKIDRSFIEAITDRAQVPAIVRGLLDLGRTLQLETLAEGVELAVQRDQLRDEHCRLAQGFLFARPLTAEDAELVLAGRVPAVPSV